MFCKLGVSLLVAQAMFLSAQVHAEDEAPLPPKYLHIGGVLAKTDSSRVNELNQSVDDGTGLQFSFGIPVGQKLSFELRAANFTYEAAVPGKTDFYNRTLGADVVYSFGDRNEVTPYVLAGGGASFNDVLPDSKDGYRGYANLGIGVVSKVFDLDWLRARLEARAVYDGFDGGQLDYQFSGGVEIPLGVVKTVETVVEKTVLVPAPVVEPVEKIVERIVEVAPPDSDNDGIADSRDKCPGTFAGAVTDNSGCVLKSAVIRINNLEFETNSSVIASESTGIVDTAADFLRNQPRLKVEVAGHTDSDGSAAMNKKLSDRRAKSVVRALKSRGIRNSMKPVGYGEAQPLVPNTSPANKSKNRRVEFRIISVD